MATDRRLTFIRKWVRRAESAKDPFDAFFSIWIALIVAAQRLRTQLGTPFRHEDDDDRQRVLDYFRVNQDRILAALREHEARMIKLAHRRGTQHANPIVGTGNAELRRRFARLAAHYTQGQRLSNDELARNVAELFNKIRNNVFHGIKVYDDRDDIEVLEQVNPVLVTSIAKM